MPLFLQEVLDLTCQTATQHLRRWTKPDNHDLVLNAAMELTRSKPELVLENMLVRQQLIVLRRQVRRPALTGRDRMLFVLLASKLRSWKQAVLAENAHPFENCVHYPHRAKHIIPGNPGQLSRLGDTVTSQSYLYGKLLQCSWVSVRLSSYGYSTGTEVRLQEVGKSLLGLAVPLAPGSTGSVERSKKRRASPPARPSRAGPLVAGWVDDGGQTPSYQKRGGRAQLYASRISGT